MKLIDIVFYRIDNQIKVRNVYFEDTRADEHEYTFMSGVKFTSDQLHWLECDLRAIFDKGRMIGARQEAQRIKQKLGLD